MQRTIHNPVLRDSVTFLRTSAETSGECTEVEAVVMPGGGNPPHFHKHYEETFTMEEGELVLDLPHGVRTILKAGDVFTVRPGEAHSFLNTTDRQARVRMLTQPGNPGFEDSIRILYGLASVGLYSKRRAPRSLRHLAVCLAISDTYLPGKQALLNVALRLHRCLGKVARHRGPTASKILRLSRHYLCRPFRPSRPSLIECQSFPRLVLQMTERLNQD